MNFKRQMKTRRAGGIRAGRRRLGGEEKGQLHARPFTRSCRVGNARRRCLRGAGTCHTFKGQLFTEFGNSNASGREFYRFYGDACSDAFPNASATVRYAPTNGYAICCSPGERRRQRLDQPGRGRLRDGR